MQFNVRATLQKQGLYAVLRGIFKIGIVLLSMLAGLGVIVLLSTVIEDIGILIMIIISLGIIILPSIIIYKMQNKDSGTMYINDNLDLMLITKNNKRISVNLLERNSTNNLYTENHTQNKIIVIIIRNINNKYKLSIVGDDQVRSSIIPILYNLGINIETVVDDD